MFGFLWPFGRKRRSDQPPHPPIPTDAAALAESAPLSAGPAPGDAAESSDFLRLKAKLESEIARLPPQPAHRLETLWAACIALGRIGQIEAALKLWSALRRASSRHVPTPLELGDAVASWLVGHGADAAQSQVALATLVVAESLSALEPDAEGQERLLGRFLPSPGAPPREIIARARALDSLLALESLLPQRAAELLMARRAELRSGR
jgi:hypothetical protein